MKDYRCIPPKENAEFVADMEDILNIYELAYNPQLPIVWLDERPYQWLGEIRETLLLRPGDNTKIDSEYVREDICIIF